MEILVWMDGEPRIVGGVAEQTTCRDVVVALAQAAGRPGRYSLVERWRDTERRLRPAEALLRALQRRGDHASEVQFLVRHSTGRKRHQQKHVAPSQHSGENITNSHGHIMSAENGRRSDKTGNFNGDSASINLLKYRTFGGMDNLNMIGRGGLVSDDARSGSDRSMGSGGSRVIDVNSGGQENRLVTSHDFVHSLESSEQDSVTSQSSVSLSPQASIDLGSTGESPQHYKQSINNHLQSVNQSTHDSKINGKYPVSKLANYGATSSKSSNSISIPGEHVKKVSRIVETESISSKVSADSSTSGIVAGDDDVATKFTRTEAEARSSQLIVNGSRNSSSSSANFSPLSSISSEVSSGSKVGNSFNGASNKSCVISLQSILHHKQYPDSNQLPFDSKASTFSGYNVASKESVCDRDKLRNNEILSPVKTGIDSKQTEDYNKRLVQANVDTNQAFPTPHDRPVVSSNNANAVSSKIIDNDNRHPSNSVDINVNQKAAISDPSSNVNYVPSSSELSSEKRSSRVKELRNFFSISSTNSLNLGLDREQLLKTVLQQNDVIMRQLQQLEELETEFSSIQSSLSIDIDGLSSSDLSPLHQGDFSPAEMELKNLKELELQIDGELSELELVSWEDKLDIEQHKEAQMTEELSILKSRISKTELEMERMERERELLERELQSVTPSLMNKQDSSIRLHELRLKNDATERQLDDLRREADSAKTETEERRSKIANLQTEILLADQCLLKLLQKSSDEKISDNKVNV